MREGTWSTLNIILGMEEFKKYDMEELHGIKKKVTKKTVVQLVDGKAILHTKPFKHSGSSLAFMARHGIRPGTMIANGFKPPKGVALKLEQSLIKNKQSNLSKKQREIVMQER